MKHVIYLYPDCTVSSEEFRRMPAEEKMHLAKNRNDMEVYTLEDFEQAFNDELISDQGFIFIL